MTEAEQWDKAYEELSQLEREVKLTNARIIKHNNIPKKVMEDCEHSYHRAMKLTSLPGGDRQTEYEDIGFFKEIYIEQWATGMSGDSFEGDIYAKLGKDLWLCVPYFC